MEEELKQVIGMDLYQDIRKLYVRETSKREIARKLGISRNTVRKYCKGEHIPGEKTHRNRRSSVLTDEEKNRINKINSRFAFLFIDVVFDLYCRQRSEQTICGCGTAFAYS